MGCHRPDRSRRRSVVKSRRSWTRRRPVSTSLRCAITQPVAELGTAPRTRRSPPTPKQIDCPHLRADDEVHARVVGRSLVGGPRRVRRKGPPRACSAFRSRSRRCCPTSRRDHAPRGSPPGSGEEVRVQPGGCAARAAARSIGRHFMARPRPGQRMMTPSHEWPETVMAAANDVPYTPTEKCT